MVISTRKQTDAGLSANRQTLQLIFDKELTKQAKVKPEEQAYNENGSVIEKNLE